MPKALSTSLAYELAMLSLSLGSHAQWALPCKASALAYRPTHVGLLDDLLIPRTLERAGRILARRDRRQLARVGFGSAQEGRSVDAPDLGPGQTKFSEPQLRASVWRASATGSWRRTCLEIDALALLGATRGRRAGLVARVLALAGDDQARPVCEVSERWQR